MMKPLENNVLNNSDYHVYTPNDKTKNMFFYPVSIGQFYYDKEYFITRDRFDSFLLMVIEEGQCKIKVADDIYYASVGDVVIIDCYKKHSYGNIDEWSNLWVHFEGPQARLQYEALINKYGHVIKPRDVNTVTYTLQKMLNMFRENNNINDATMSKCLTNILTELFLSDSNRTLPTNSVLNIESVISYIRKNYNKQITIDNMAEYSNLSSYYFIRLFKQETGVTPYQFLIETRLNIAKFALKTTNETIENIALSSGFNSVSVFCSTFKKRMSITPSQYRVMNSDD